MKRDRAEYSGATFAESHLNCPKCNSKTHVLQTPITKKIRGIECSNCDWSQYPETKHNKATISQLKQFNQTLLENFPPKKGES